MCECVWRGCGSRVGRDPTLKTLQASIKKAYNTVYVTPILEIGFWLEHEKDKLLRNIFKMFMFWSSNSSASNTNQLIQNVVRKNKSPKLHQEFH